MSKYRESIYFFLWVITLPLKAQILSYTIQAPTSSEKPYYFIKLGAFSKQEYAIQAAKKAKIPTKIHFLKKYYSLLSAPYKTKEEAQQSLQNIHQTFKDAYILTLYPKKAPSREKTKPHPLLKNIKQNLYKETLQNNRNENSLQKAITDYQQKLYEEAFVTLDRILIEDPSNLEAGLYYAKTLEKLHFVKEAYEAFVKLSKIKHHPQIQKEAQSALDRLQTQKQKSLFIETSIGLGYDDNLNLNTQIPTTVYGPYLLHNDTNKTKSKYILATLKLTKLSKIGQYNLYTTLYSYNELFHSASHSDLNYLDLSVTLKREHQNITFLIPVGYNTTFLDYHKISANLYTKPTLLYQLSTPLLLSLSSLYKDDHIAFAPDRDYQLLGAGIGIRYHKKRVDTHLNTTYHHYDAKSSLRYDINKIAIAQQLYIKYQLFTKLYLKAQLGWERNSYQDIDPLLNYQREDKSINGALSLEKRLSNQSAIESSWYYRHNSSNINLYTYTKHNYTLQYKHKF